MIHDFELIMLIAQENDQSVREVTSGSIAKCP
jgi:hypothetical protein